MKVQLKFICNKEIISGEFNPAITVLDFLRNMKDLKGTKEGCREGDCGACTVLVGELSGNNVVYKNINSCLLPLGDIDGKHLVSVEGLNTDGLNPFQQFLVNNGGTQCGFCTPGFVMSFAAFLLSSDTLNLSSAKDYLTGNLCRCTGHQGIVNSAKDILYILSKKEINAGQDGIIFGYSMPGAVVLLNIEGKVISVTADENGYYTYIYKNVPVGVFTISATAKLGDVNSLAPTNDVTLTSLSFNQQITEEGKKVVEKVKQKVPFDFLPFILLALAFLIAIGILLYKLRLRLWVIIIDFFRRRKKMHHDWFLDHW